MNYDFYCDINKISDLEIEYRNAIEKLTDYYYQLNTVVNEVECDGYWKGETFDAFKAAFDAWKENYIRNLNALILLDCSLSCIYDVSAQLIVSRSSLGNYL